MKFYIFKYLCLITIIGLYNRSFHVGNSLPSGGKGPDEHTLSTTSLDNSSENGEIIELRFNYIYYHNESYEYGDPTNKIYALISYPTNDEQKAKLADHKTIGKIKFNNFVLEFENSSHLQNCINFTYIGIFVCKHNYPVMVRFRSLNNNHFYYFALDPDSKRFKNIAFDFRGRDMAEIDPKTGVASHPTPKTGSDEYIYKQISSDWDRLFGEICKDHILPSACLSNPLLHLLVVPYRTSEDVTEI